MTSKQLDGDRPISRPEDDAFGLSSFADALATSLLQMSPKDGLVISVEGPWGAGKSSAISLALRTVMLRILSSLGQGRDDLESLDDSGLEERWKAAAKLRRTHIVRFNPWNFSGQENLVRAFFGELSSQLSVEPDGWFRRRLDKASYYLPAIGSTIGTGGALLTGSPLPGIAAAAGTVGRAIGEVGQKALRIDASLENAKKKLAGTLKEADHRIIVVIDDLDRLLPNEMRSVFSLVKSLGDLPNVLYLLSFDDGIVHKGLQQSAEKIDPEFLDKIVQVSLKLPPPWREELQNFLILKLNAIIGDEEPADPRRFRDAMIHVIDPYLKTPRDVTRLANSLQVVWPNVVGDVDLTDIITLTALQLFDHKAYAFIKNEIETLTWADHGYEDEKDFSKRMEPTMASNPIAAKEAMGILFPRLGKVWRVMGYDSSDYLMQKAQRRIGTKEYHRNYFVFGRDPRLLSRNDIENVIKSKKPTEALSTTIDRLASIQQATTSPRVASLLNQIGELVYEKPLLTAGFVEALLDHSDQLILREDEVTSFFRTQNYDRIRNIIHSGTERLDQKDRTDILDTLVGYENGLQIRVNIIERDARYHGLFGQDAKHPSERLFDASEIEAAASAIRDQVATCCRSMAVWAQPKPSKIIWAWKRMSDAPTVATWVREVIESGEHVISLATALPQKVYITDSDGTRVKLTFDRSDYEEFLDIDALYESLKKNHTLEATTALQRLEEAEKANDD